MANVIPHPIAIIGSACRLPGNSSSPSKLWKLLLSPKDVLKEVPRDRFQWEGIYRQDGLHNSSRTKTGYWLEENIRVFDASFFGVSPAEAETIDPQHRLLLENIYEAIESAGLTLEDLQGTDTGVFVGMMGCGYYDNANRDIEACSGQILSTGTSRAMASNRISYTFDLRGPSMTLDTACSSSMMAVHLAVASLRRRESTLAFACGTNLNLNPNDYVSLTKMNMISPDGRCKMFDETANGYGRGEGTGVVCLKRLDAAVRDGDHIECVIRETGTNQDGRTKGITMPSADAQAALIRKTYKSAGLDPARVGSRPSYFEAHGTGTYVGDPLEAEAVEAAFFPPGHEYDEDEILYIGSVKTILGHTEGTAGIAGLLRAALAVQYGYIPPNSLYARMNPNVAQYTKHLRVITAANIWPALPVGCPRRASINSFGFGGSNVHVIVESYEKSPTRRIPSVPSFPCPEPIFTPFTFSAISEKALVSVMESYLNYLEGLEGHTPTVSLRDLAFTLQYKRSQFPFRHAITAVTLESLCKQLRDAVKIDTVIKETRPFVRASRPARPRIMGVFTGQGSQWAGMGKDLIDRSPYAIEILAKLDGYLSSLPEDDRPSWTLRDELTISSSRSRVNEAVISQPLTTAIQILLVDLLDIAGVKLNSVVGHSSGEIAAAYAAGLISSKDAIRVAYYRGLHSRHAAGPDGQAGAMIATALTAEQAIGFCDLPAVEKRIVPAAFTGPSIVTLSGDAEIVDRAMLMLESQNIFVKKLKVEKAYHSFHMLPCIEPYLQSLHQCGVGRLPVIPPFQDSPTWFSSLYPGERLDPSRVLHWSYWAENLRSPVRFSEAITTAISEMGVPDIFLEIGPGAVLKSPVFQIIADSGKNGTIYTGLLNRGSNSIATVSEALGQIWARFGKAAVNFAQYDRTFSHAPKPVLMKALPTYPWLHDKEYWWESRFVRRQSQLDYPPTELLGEEISTGAQHEAKWRRFLRPKNIPWLLDHKLNGVPVFPGAAYIAMAASAARRIFSQHAIEMIEVGDIQFKLPISFSDDIPAVEIVLTVTNIHSTSQSGQADFVVDFCSHQRRDSLMTAALGRLNVQFGTDDDRKYPESMVTCATLTKLDISAFYDTLNKNGYAYTGPFRAITTLQRRLDFSTGTIQFSSSEMIFHPAILDALFHSTFAAQSYPGDSAMLSFRVPSRIRSIKVFPVRCDEMATSGNQAIEFNAARTGPSEYVGLLHAPNGIGTVIQMEGFSTSALRLSSPEDDLKMFSEVVWRSYVRDARSLASDCAISRHESVGAMACERVAFFILRRLNESVSVDEEQRAESSLQYLLQFGRLVVGEALLGLSPHIGLEWFKDTEEMIGNIVAENSDIVDMRLLEALGKAYLQIIRGQIGALSVLTENDMLTELYTNGLGLPEANSALTHVVSQISHRSPNIRILEVGAGTGAVTGRILASATYSSYTFTDISPAFLGPAKEKFKRFANKMTFSALDLDKDFAAQGYEPQSFDVIVASNVLHALDNLNAALSQVRQLLKPGGYLACLELPASCRISNTVIIGGLTGCWAGRRSGRSLTPALTEQQWDFALKEAGFAGVDAISPMEDEFQVSYRLFVAQAIEDRVTALRDPLAHGLSKSDDSLMIIGGNTFGDELYCEDVERTLSPFFRETIRIPTIEILRQHTNIPHAVLCLADIEEPIFENMTVAKWSALQKLLTEATDILWVTTGCKSPTRIKSTYSHMMIGLARSVRMEIRDLRLRFLDIDDLNAVSARTVAQVMLEWRLLGRFAAEGWHDRVLFAHDTELAMENGMLLAQAVVHADEENERYNSQQRHIFKKVRPYDSPIEVSYSSENEVYHIRGAHQTAVATAEGEFVSVTMLYTTMYAIKVKKIGFIFIGVGVCGDGKHVVVLSPTTRSVLRLPRHAVYPISMPIDLGPNHIRIIAAQIVAEYVVGAYQGTGRILVLTSDAICLSQIRKVASEHKRGLVFITSDSAFETPGVAFLHRNVSDTHIRRAVPKDISLVVNLSNQSENEVLFKRVTSVLEPSCAKIKRFESVFRPYAYGHDSIGDFSSGSKALAEVEACLKDFGQASLAMHDSTASKVVSVKDIAHKSPRDAFTVLDWTALDRVPITVQPATTTVRFAPNKTYIIIGSSDLAQSLGEWMVNSGARYIVMTSRNPSVASGWAQDMHSKGAYVDLQSMDVTDSSSVGQVFSSIRSAPNKQGVTAPPIGGVIHLGLSLKDSAFSNMKLEDLRKASDVKTKGSLNLHSHLLKENLDFFILTSSISYIAGNRGQANYNAGNAFMAGLAHYRRNIGLPATVVHLGNVTGVGYITRVTQGSENNKRNLEELTSVESLRKRGAYPVSERDLQQIYAEAVLASPADSGRHPEIITGIRPVEPDMVDGAFWAKLPLFAHLISQGTTTSSTNSATETTRPSLSIRERLAKELFSTETEPTTTATTSSTFPKRPSASSAVLRAVLQQALIDRLSILLQIDVQDIDPETNLLDLGIDSLVATEIGSWAMKELKVQVPQSLIFGGATVGGIAEFVAKRMDGSDLGMERKGKRANGKAEVKGEKATRKA